MYTCAFCKKEHEMPEERARCELGCAEQARREEEDRRTKEMEKARAGRAQAITDRFNELSKLVDAYNRDYKEKASFYRTVPRADLFFGLL